ncbi:MAG: Ig domain-containing protein, partial [Candidatus Gracilibacteria bacterium]|nr:Ig domain-containing protein [Candidatus Gracilibacteria bacterium]
DTITAGVQVQGTKGAFVIAGDNITYTPAAGQTGSDICTIRIADGQGHTIDRTITVNNIDTLAPATPTLSLAAGAAYTKNLNIAASVTDDVGATGWYISESSSTPALGDFVAEPNTFNLSGGDGLKTVYVWTRDAVGNISNAGSDTITLDTIAPTLTNIPGFGGSVASGATIPKTISMQDNNALFTGSSMVSITTTYGSITGFDSSDYGDNKPFNYVAPVNDTGAPVFTTITYTIRDAAGNETTYTDNFMVEVAVANNAPTGPALADVSRGDQFGGAPIIPIDCSTGVADADGGDVLTYSAVGLPAELSIDPSTGIITGTIDALGNTDYNPVTVTVDDGHGGTLVRSFKLTMVDQG